MTFTIVTSLQYWISFVLIFYRSSQLSSSKHIPITCKTRFHKMWWPLQQVLDPIQLCMMMGNLVMKIAQMKIVLNPSASYIECQIEYLLLSDIALSDWLDAIVLCTIGLKSCDLWLTWLLKDLKARFWSSTIHYHIGILQEAPS